MLQASSELYSCAPRVYMPAARAQKGAKVQNKAGGGNTKTTCCRPQLHGTPSSDVFELGKALKFDEEVVLSRCPQSLGYKKALEIGLNGGFIPGTTRERERTRPLALGRHNCRGELKRHAPCHLRSQSLPLDAKLLTTTAPRLFLEALENSTPIANSCVAPEVFPVVPSEEWEAKTLLRLSSATARRFRRQHGHDLTPPEAEPATTAAAAAAVPPTSRERRETPAAKPSLADEKSRDRNKAASTPATTARYLAEFLSGALPVHSPHCADTTIVLDNRSKYDKVLQDRFPHAPQRWCPGCNAPHVARACTRGVQRWTDLPQPSEPPEVLRWTCQQLDECNSTTPAANLPTQPAATTDGDKYFRVVKEWCQLWHVLLDSLELTEVSCMRSLLSLSNADQVCGIVASVVMARAPPPVGGATPAVGHRVVEELCRLLASDTERVRVCAGMALYCMDMHIEKAQQVLLDALGSKSQPEGWAAMQCLAMAGVCHGRVIRSLVGTLVGTGDPSKSDRAIELLASLSWGTPLVAAEASVLLNSDGWRERVAGCLVMGRLHGTLSRDLVHRLSFLMWEDPSREVKMAAARALGKAGEAKMICDEIQKRLSTDSGPKRLAAIKMLGSLKLMTPQLLPGYLLCFKDDHISIRIEAIMIAGALKLTDANVLGVLVDLLSDPCWKVKVHTLRALGDIGWYDGALIDQLLWAARFEKLGAVRAEACHALGTLGVKQEKVVTSLKEMTIVEEDTQVIREACGVLEKLGYETHVEDSALGMIRAEVCRLGTGRAIRTTIMASDKAAITDYVLERPKEIPSTRDYLNDKLRDKFYADADERYTLQRGEGEQARASSQGSQGRHKRAWSPDRATIDTQLEGFRATITAQRAAIARRSTTLAPDLARRSTTLAPDLARRSTTLAPDLARRSTTLAPDLARRSTTLAPDLARGSTTLTPDLARGSTTLTPDLARGSTTLGPKGHTPCQERVKG